MSVFNQNGNYFLKHFLLINQRKVFNSKFKICVHSYVTLSMESYTKEYWEKRESQAFDKTSYNRIEKSQGRKRVKDVKKSADVHHKPHTHFETRKRFLLVKFLRTVVTFAHHSLLS